jgi:UDP-galactopyranose mutase
MPTAKVLVLGAGLSGLSAAYHLGQDCTLLEKGARAGGLCLSEKFPPGFTFDHAIHILYTKDAYCTGLIKRLLGKNISRQERESWIFSNRVFTRYPYQANLHGLPQKTVKECVDGVISARRARPIKQENFREWIYATFGEGIAGNFMVPYNEKVWGYPLEKMGHGWIEGRVPVPSVREVLEGSRRPQEKRYGPNSEFWYPEKGGINALAAALAEKVKNIRLGCEVTAISAGRKTVTINGETEMRYEKLISSIPLPRLVSLIEDAPASLRRLSARLASNTVITVNIGLRRKPALPYHWVYFPEREYVFHRVSFPHNFSASMAPPGCGSVQAEITCSKHKRVIEGAVMEDTVSGLCASGIIEEKDIIHKSSFRLEPAYVIYTLDHAETVSAMHQKLNACGICPIGRFGDWEYYNMDQSILSGKRCAERLRSG